MKLFERFWCYSFYVYFYFERGLMVRERDSDCDDVGRSSRFIHLDCAKFSLRRNCISVIDLPCLYFFFGGGRGWWASIVTMKHFSLETRNRLIIASQTRSGKTPLGPVHLRGFDRKFRNRQFYYCRFSPM